MYKWFLAWRYLHTKLIALFGVASVTLCVAMVLVVLSVMGGFLDTVRSRSKGLHSQIVLDSGFLQGFPYYAEFGELVEEELPEVVKLTSPAIYSYGIFRVPATSYTKPARILGVRLDEYLQLNEMRKGLHYERYYPGTTHLGMQQMPVAGFDANGDMQLAQDLREANKKWRQDEKDVDSIANFDAEPFELSMYPKVVPTNVGSRAFALGPEEPGYIGREKHGVIVGCDLLNSRRSDGNFDRHLARGTDVAITLLPLTSRGNVTGEPPVRVPLRYADDSRTGIFEIDSMSVYVDFDFVQHKLGMDAQDLVDGGKSDARANQLLVGIHDGVDLDEAAAQIRELWAGFVETKLMDVSPTDRYPLTEVSVMTWEDMQRPLIAAVEKEKILVTFLFALISIVAIVLLGCIFFMIVEKKTRDIGIMKAIGASSRGVAGLFVAYAGAVGVTGSILGLFIGSLFVWNINDIQDFLANLNPQLRVWSPEIYSFDTIPEVVKKADAIWVAAIAVVSSIVGSLIPATLAGRVWPVQALRYE